MAISVGAALLAAAGAAPGMADEIKGVFAPSGGTSGSYKSGGRVFGKTGGDGAGTKFVVPPGEGKGGKAPGFVYEYKTGDGEHRRKPHRRFPRHRFPVIVYPLGGTYAIATDPYDDAEDAEEEAEDDGIFAITNGTDEEMTVYDNGEPVCVLAPKVRCSFDISKGRHDVSVRLGQGEARREIPRASGGKMIVVWEALKKAE